MNHSILVGDSLSVLKSMQDESVQCCVTSPPYFGLRKYSDDASEIGLETSYLDYVSHLRDVFHEVKRVLKSDGILWLNINDSYAGSGRGQTQSGCADLKRAKMKGIKLKNSIGCGIPAKNLMMIPHRVAMALQDDGWILRQENIWEKGNALPESVKDRSSRSHEYVFMFTKSKKYQYNFKESLEPCVNGSDIDYRRKLRRENAEKYSLKTPYKNNFPKKFRMDGMRNMRSVWKINTKPFKGDHPAVFPIELPTRCIKASCNKGDVVLDCFCGAGTTGLAAEERGCNFIGIELNEAYAKMANTRINNAKILL